MKFEQLNGFAYDSNSGALGAVAGVDFLKQTISIMLDDENVVVAKLKEVEFLENVGYIGKQGIINHDVVATTDGKLYEIELVDADNVQLHLLDNRSLERVDVGDKLPKSDLSALEPYVKFVGNIYELEAEEVVDFNIKVVRMNVNGEIKFFYACNNADVAEIDLIKVVFVGHNLLEEESYERITLSHEEYLADVASGAIIETEPQALMNYMTGLMYGRKQEKKVEPKVETPVVDEDEEDLVDEDYCQECGESVDRCECEEW